MTFSLQVIQELLAGSTRQRLELQKTYEQLPLTRCRRRTHCCSLLPEMNLLEALAAIQLLVDMVPAKRLQLTKRLVRYFFLNPVEILSCPFLAGQNCLFYEHRFFGCRSYGLWSKGYYQQQAARSRQAKQLSQKQWQQLGVSLSQEVVDFQLPYCSNVELEQDVSVDDEMLMNISETIDSLSGQLAPWHDSFQQSYFSDLSFLFASQAFGLQAAIRLKFEMVRDVLASGDRKRLNHTVDQIDDFLENIKY